jgi:pimeloyl-ACP methyl ester carboxylesterase
MDVNYVALPASLVLGGILVCWTSLRRLSSLSEKTLSSGRKLTERFLLSLVALGSLMVALSSGVNAILLHDARRSPPGTIYQVNGRSMRMYCLGSGAPTIVLDSGLGNDGLIWGGLQPVLAKTTQVCSYDRAGYGWSDPGPAPRDANSIADDLHALLGAAHIDGPLVLMGHSISGIYIRAFATRYPQHLAGLIFVDGSTPWQNRNPAFHAEMAHAIPNGYTTLRNRLIFAMGIPRLFGACAASRFPGFDAAMAKLEGASQCHLALAAIAGEGANFDLSGTETIHTGPYGDLPILIFSQDPAKSTGRAAAMGTAWNQMQENLKNLSTHSRRIIAKGSTHYLQMDRADLLAREVPLFIEQLRGAAPPPVSYGATTTE